MNERYLFRGKRLDNGEWQYGLIVCGGMCGTAWIMRGSWVISESTIEERVFEVDPATVGQCTGVHAAKSYRGDKPEDKLVFEGDIYITHGCILEVIWDYGLLDCLKKRISNAWNIEIIGNIHDNPELLNEGSGKP